MTVRMNMRLGRLLLVVAAAVLGAASCEGEHGRSYARRIESPSDLIGGPGALGTTGDWLIGNQQVRVIIQDQGWSRGFGIFGGGIIDADLNRATPFSSDTGFGQGRDNFGEFFPALFLQAFDVADQVTRDADGNEITLAGLEVIADGSDGGPAILRARASGGDFFTMIKVLIDAAVPPGALMFETDYVIHPGARHVEIIGRLKNTGNRDVELPDPALLGLLNLFGVSDFQLPLGDVALFGDGNQVFAPGAVHRPSDPHNPKPIGFDLRFAVEASYETPRELPALPGIVVPFLATAGPGVSYGYAVGDSERNFVWLNRDAYDSDPQIEVTQHAMLVPFLISSFTGAFYEVPPAVLPGKSEFEYRKYFVVGTGDVASIRDEIYKIRGTPTGTFAGEVLEEQTGQPAADMWIHIMDAQGRPFSQVQPAPDGRFRCELEAGTYYWLLTGPGRYPYGGGGETRFSEANRFEILAPQEDGTVKRDVFQRLYAPRPGRLVVNVRDEAGRPLPAKVSVVANYAISEQCRQCTDNCPGVCDPRNYLFDFSLGEGRRSTDLSWFDEPPTDGRYVEEMMWGANGEVSGTVRPSKCRIEEDGQRTGCEPYTLYISRGPEYDVQTIENVVIHPGQAARYNVVLRRVVDTTNFVSADFHIHARPSADSFVSLEDRVISGAAEGLEILVSTDHNVVTDYGPTIRNLGLQDWVTSIVGVELTTLETGHFNGFPVAVEPSSPTGFPFVKECFEVDASKVNGTAFDWVQCAPDQLFDNLRSLGSYGPDNVIVQVNHPRDSILGYFNQYYVNPYTLEAEVPNGANYPFVEFLHPQNSRTNQYDYDKFSLNFDAIEIFNGKRLDQLHAFRTPHNVSNEVLAEISNYQCNQGHHLNGPGEVLLEKGGHISYPGAFDDYLRLLNRGYRFAATANSDTHELEAEIGTPRTYLYFPPAEDGTPGDAMPTVLHPLDVVEALRANRAVGTNGPLLTLTVITEGDDGSSVLWPVGSTVTFASDARGSEVKVLVSVKSAPWVDVDRIVIYGNGEVIDEILIPEGNHPDGTPIDDTFSLPRTYTFQRDTVLVAEAFGSDDMFPVVTPRETPPVNINEALSALLESFGAGAFGNNDGERGPNYIQRVTPYAFTNPIWLDITGPDGEGDPDGEFNPPGNDPGPGPALSEPPGLCDATNNNACPLGQVCDTGQSPPRCVCDDSAVETRALMERVPEPVRMLYADPKPGQHYVPSDIRKVFGAHFACQH